MEYIVSAGQFFPHQTNGACADCLENNFISAGQQRWHTCRPNSDVVFAGQFFSFQTNAAKLTALKTLSIFQAASGQHFPFCCLPHPVGRANQDFRRLPPEQQVQQEHRSCASACTRRWLPDPALRGRTPPCGDGPAPGACACCCEGRVRREGLLLRLQRRWHGRLIKLVALDERCALGRRRQAAVR